MQDAWRVFRGCGAGFSVVLVQDAWRSWLWCRVFQVVSFTCFDRVVDICCGCVVMFWTVKVGGTAIFYFFFNFLADNRVFFGLSVFVLYFPPQTVYCTGSPHFFDFFWIFTGPGSPAPSGRCVSRLV